MTDELPAERHLKSMTEGCTDTEQKIFLKFQMDYIAAEAALVLIFLINSVYIIRFRSNIIFLTLSTYHQTAIDLYYK